MSPTKQQMIWVPEMQETRCRRPLAAIMSFLMSRHLDALIDDCDAVLPPLRCLSPSENRVLPGDILSFTAERKGASGRVI
jgi:hypothetical protein